ncbi:MAG: glycosyltransferase family 39 protein [Flavobacteriales bacterium]
MNLPGKYRNLSWVLLLIPIYLFLFVKLGSPHIRLWDEGWFAVHAVEMLDQGSWLVSYFNGEPSFTSSKPPLQTWLQMLSISLLGVSELAVRLPSAVASAIVVLLIFFSSRKELGHEVAMMSAMVLLTSIGFIGYHTGRGAEADALITLCLTLQFIFFYRFSQTRDHSSLWMLLFVIGVGFWAKSMATVLFLPGFALYTIIYKRSLVIDLLKSWQLYVGILGAVAIMISYIFLRESAQPGYLGMFFRSNVGRYTQSVGHDHWWIYYFRNMIDGRYMWWMPLAAAGIVISFFKDEARPFVTLASISALVYLLVISFSRSKLVWYDMPFYPLAAISTAYGINSILKSQVNTRKSVLVAVLFFFPTFRMFQHTQAMTLNLQEMDFESQEIFLNKAFRQKKDLNNVIVVHDHFEGSILFYKHKFATIGQELILQNEVDGISQGDRLLLRAESHKEKLESRYHYEILDSCRTAVLYRVTGTIPQEMD